MHRLETKIEKQSEHIPLECDEDGYLLHPELWSHEMAQILAANISLPRLTFKHLQLTHFIRDYFFELGGFASPHQICSELGVNQKEMKAFFGSCTNAWKVAGLPNPGEEANTYMS